MAVLRLRLRSGLHLIGFLHAADDLGAGARKSRTPPWELGRTPPRQGIATGGFLHGAYAVPPRTQELAGAGLHGLHGDEGLFPEQLFLNIGDGDEDLLRGRLDACAAYRTLRLRGGGDGDDLGTGMHQKHGWSLRGGDPDVGFRIHHGADLAPGLAPPRKEYGDLALVGGSLFLRGGHPDGDLAQDVIGSEDRGEDLGGRLDADEACAAYRTLRLGTGKHQHDGCEPDACLVAPGLAPPRNKYNDVIGAALLQQHQDGGEDPARRIEDGYTGLELERRVRLRHGDDGLLLNIGDGGEDRGSRRDDAPRSVGLWGGEHLVGGRLDAAVVSAAYRTLRLRGGDGGDDDDGVPPPSHSWLDIMGFPMIQTVPGTCALVAATVCIEAQHRRMFEKDHGPGTFPCRAAAPRKLRQACLRDKVWNPSTHEHERTWDRKTGAWSMGRVLAVMKQLGGARTTNARPTPAPFFIPLDNWERYSYEDGDLTAEIAARLLYKGGPCIGTLLATPEFFDTFIVPGSNRPPAVYRGCSREERKELRRTGQGTMHAVVCFAYGRSKKGRLCIQILDSQRAAGPVRWVDFDEFDVFYVLSVQALSSAHLLDFGRFPPLHYPVSNGELLGLRSSSD